MNREQLSLIASPLAYHRHYMNYWRRSFRHWRRVAGEREGKEQERILSYMIEARRKLCYHSRQVARLLGC